MYNETGNKSVCIQHKSIAISFSVQLQCFRTKFEFAEQADALNILQNVAAAGIQLMGRTMKLYQFDIIRITHGERHPFLLMRENVSNIYLFAC